MNRTFTIVGVLIACWISVFGQTTEKASDKDSKAKEQVTALAKELVNALSKGDTATLERILSEDYAEIEQGGMPVSRKMLIDAVKAQANTPIAMSIAFDVSDANVRLYGDVAIMGVIAKVKWSGIAKPTRNLVTLVAVNKNEHWQFVMAQYTEIETHVSKPRPD